MTPGDHERTGKGAGVFAKFWKVSHYTKVTAVVCRRYVVFETVLFIPTSREMRGAHGDAEHAHELAGHFAARTQLEQTEGKRVHRR